MAGHISPAISFDTESPDYKARTWLHGSRRIGRQNDPSLSNK